MAKPLLFVGSSSEAKPFVERLTEQLCDFSNPHPWYVSPVFQNMESTFSSLVNATSFYDFAVFALTADDITISRKRQSHSIRDNVLFELALFLGALGPKRTIGLMEHVANKPIKIPSDFLGIHVPRLTYTDDNSMISAVAKAIPNIRKQVDREGLRKFELRKRFGFDPRTETFTIKIDPVKMHAFRDIVVGQGLAIMIRKYDEDKSAVSDPNVVFGDVREISSHDDEVSVKAGGKGCLGKLKGTDVVEARLLLVPKDVNLKKAKTLKSAQDLGCRALDGVGQQVGSGDGSK